MSKFPIVGISFTGGRVTSNVCMSEWCCIIHKIDVGLKSIICHELYHKPKMHEVNVIFKGLGC